MSDSRDGTEGQDLEEVVDTLEDAADGAAKVSIGGLLDAFGRSSYGPLLLLPALLTASPVGAIPGMSVSMAAVIVLVAGQMMWGRHAPWVPAFLRRIAFKSKRLHQTVEHGRPAAQAVDRATARRLAALTRATAVRVAGLQCLALAVLIFPLAVVPLGVLAPAVAIIVIAVAISARDGLLMLIAMTLAAGALAGSTWLLATSDIELPF